jgi:hypothetical protein
MYIYVYIN